MGADVSIMAIMVVVLGRWCSSPGACLDVGAAPPLGHEHGLHAIWERESVVSGLREL